VFIFSHSGEAATCDVIASDEIRFIHIFIGSRVCVMQFNLLVFHCVRNQPHSLAVNS